MPQPIARPGGVTHFDEARAHEFDLGHLRGRWTRLGHAAGSVTAGVNRIELPPGAFSTPLHDHGAEEEIFYVLSGAGISFQRASTCEIRAGDCIVYRPRGGAHTVYTESGIDLLAFGTRQFDDAIAFPRLERSIIGSRWVGSEGRVVDGVPIQFIAEGELGPPELPETPGPRPRSIVNVDEVEPERVDRPRVVRERRNLGWPAGSITSGLQHVTLAPGSESAPPHCHSLEEELFVVLEGEDGVLVLGDTEMPVRPGHVVARPAGTGVAHMFVAGAEPMRLLAYGTRNPGDVCFYPRSNKLSFRGVGVIGRLERLDYWDGED